MWIFVFICQHNNGTISSTLLSHIDLLFLSLSSFSLFPATFIFIASFAVSAFMFSSVTVFSFLNGINPVNIFSIRLGVITTYLFTIVVCLLFNETTSSTRPSQNIKIDMQMSFSEIEDPIQNGDQEEICYLINGFFWNWGFHKDFFLSSTSCNVVHIASASLIDHFLLLHIQIYSLSKVNFMFFHNHAALGNYQPSFFLFFFFIIFFIYSWLELLHFVIIVSIYFMMVNSVLHWKWKANWRQLTLISFSRISFTIHKTSISWGKHI